MLMFGVFRMYLMCCVEFYFCRKCFSNVSYVM